jgi:hypothetical protein
MNKPANIEDMTLQERTEAYTRHRSAEMRGEVPLGWLNGRTEKYISRRLAQLRGEAPARETVEEHPYIKRRLAELRQKTNETTTY